MRIFHFYNAFRLLCGISIVLLISSITQLCGISDHKSYFDDLNHGLNKKCPSLISNANTLFSLLDLNVTQSRTQKSNANFGIASEVYTPPLGVVKNRLVHVSTAICVEINFDAKAIFSEDIGGTGDHAWPLMTLLWIAGMLILWASFLLVALWMFDESFNDFWSFIFTLMEFFLWNMAFYMTILIHWRWHTFLSAGYFDYSLPYQVWIIELIYAIVLVVLALGLVCTDKINNMELRFKSSHRSFDLLHNNAGCFEVAGPMTMGATATSSEESVDPTMRSVRFLRHQQQEHQHRQQSKSLLAGRPREMRAVREVQMKAPSLPSSTFPSVASRPLLSSASSAGGSRQRYRYSNSMQCLLAQQKPRGNFHPNMQRHGSTGNGMVQRDGPIIRPNNASSSSNTIGRGVVQLYWPQKSENHPNDNKFNAYNGGERASRTNEVVSGNPMRAANEAPTKRGIGRDPSAGSNFSTGFPTNSLEAGQQPPKNYPHYFH